MPDIGRISSKEKLPRQINAEAYAEKVTAIETLNRINVRKLLNR
jgi:hypothetical protein